tara:strand:- start:179 stop:436 length:258 start_codon:yes stop_codon:yes gene_type:complete
MEGITTLFFIVKILLLLPLLLGFSVPAIAHNEANGGCGDYCDSPGFYLDNLNTTEPNTPVDMEEGEGAETEDVSFDAPANFGQLE